MFRSIGGLCPSQFPWRIYETRKRQIHAVVAMEYADCPIQQICFGIATGFGGAPTGLCEHLNAEEGECKYEGPITNP
jgi:hypothetical protein